MSYETRIAAINFSDKISVEPDTVMISSGLVYEPGRRHNKETSTDLYTTDSWVPAGESVATGQRLISSEEGMTVFKVPDKLIDAIVEQNNPKSGENGGEPFVLGEKIREAGTPLVEAVLGEEYALDSQAVMLRSYPSKGISTGKTTNGFHFDKGSNNRIRLGINLGDIPRRSIYVSTSRQEILNRLGVENEGDVAFEIYPAIANLSLTAVGVKINSGEGWSLPTVDYLHDGRRAVPDGFSSFVLFSATRNVSRASAH